MQRQSEESNVSQQNHSPFQQIEVLYWQGLFDMTRHHLLDDYQKEVAKMHKVSRKKHTLDGEKFYTQKLSKSDRLLFWEFEDIDDAKYLILIEVIFAHGYQKSWLAEGRRPALKNYINLLKKHLTDFFAKRREAAVRAKTEECTMQTPNSQWMPFDLQENKLIVLDKYQQDFLLNSLPFIGSGVPGGGKSSGLSSRLSAYVNSTPDIGKKIIVVAESLHLLKERQKDWQLSPAYMGSEHRVGFYTYQQLKEILQKKLVPVDQSNFDEWLKAYIHSISQQGKAKGAKGKSNFFKNNSSRDICQGLCLIGPHSEEARKALGVKQCKFTDPQQKIYLAEAAEAYKKYLSDNQFYHRAFTNIAEGYPLDSFEAVFGDEMQKYKLQQIKSLGLLCNWNLWLLIDDQQGLDYDDPMRVHVETLIRGHLGNKRNLVTKRLDDTYRSVKASEPFLNRLLELGSRYGEGTSGKNDYTAINSVIPEKGGIFYLQDLSGGANPEEEKPIIEFLKQVNDNHDFAILTAEKNIAEVKAKFGSNVTVVTVEQSQGLERKYVLCYRLCDEPIFEKMAVKAKEIDFTVPANTHRAKKGKGNNNFRAAINYLWVAATRGKYIFIYQPITNKLADFLKLLYEVRTPSYVLYENTEVIQSSTPEDWEYLVVKLIEIGNFAQARSHWINRLGRSEESYVEFEREHLVVEIINSFENPITITNATSTTTTTATTTKSASCTTSTSTSNNKHTLFSSRQGNSPAKNTGSVTAKKHNAQSQKSVSSTSNLGSSRPGQPEKGLYVASDKDKMTRYFYEFITFIEDNKPNKKKLAEFFRNETVLQFFHLTLFDQETTFLKLMESNLVKDFYDIMYENRDLLTRLFPLEVLLQVHQKTKKSTLTYLADLDIINGDILILHHLFVSENKVEFTEEVASILLNYRHEKSNANCFYLLSLYSDGCKWLRFMLKQHPWFARILAEALTKVVINGQGNISMLHNMFDSSEARCLLFDILRAAPLIAKLISPAIFFSPYLGSKPNKFSPIYYLTVSAVGLNILRFLAEKEPLSFASIPWREWWTEEAEVIKNKVDLIQNCKIKEIECSQDYEAAENEYRMTDKKKSLLELAAALGAVGKTIKVAKDWYIAQQREAAAVNMLSLSFTVDIRIRKETLRSILTHENAIERLFLMNMFNNLPLFANIIKTESLGYILYDLLREPDFVRKLFAADKFLAVENCEINAMQYVMNYLCTSHAHGKLVLETLHKYNELFPLSFEQLRAPLIVDLGFDKASILFILSSNVMPRKIIQYYFSQPEIVKQMTMKFLCKYVTASKERDYEPTSILYQLMSDEEGLDALDILKKQSGKFEELQVDKWRERMRGDKNSPIRAVSAQFTAVNLDTMEDLMALHFKQVGHTEGVVAATSTLPSCRR